MKADQHLSRRERQIMDVLHARREASAVEVMEALPDPPSYSAVRALLRILEQKGHIKHREEGARYVYLPCLSQKSASRSALRRVVTTFFQGSVAQTVAALLDQQDTKISDRELDDLRRLIEKTRKEGR
jgi:BlaI family transcriptional regulator, penicillinase repressor